MTLEATSSCVWTIRRPSFGRGDDCGAARGGRAAALVGQQQLRLAVGEVHHVPNVATGEVHAVNLLGQCLRRPHPHREHPMQPKRHTLRKIRGRPRSRRSSRDSHSQQCHGGINCAFDRGFAQRAAERRTGRLHSAFPRCSESAPRTLAASSKEDLTHNGSIDRKRRSLRQPPPNPSRPSPESAPRSRGSAQERRGHRGADEHGGAREETRSQEARLIPRPRLMPITVEQDRRKRRLVARATGILTIEEILHFIRTARANPGIETWPLLFRRARRRHHD